MQNRVKIGFFKAPQGAFSREVIDTIKRTLTIDYDVIEADFRQGVLIDGKVYVGNICLNDCDVYFWHDTLKPADHGADNYFIHLLRALEKDTIVINTAFSTEVTNDKLKAHEKLRAAGLPVSEYALVKTEDRAGIEKAFYALGSEVLIKPRFGGWGSGIVRCNSIEDLHSIIEMGVALKGTHTSVLLERFYKNNADDWVSVSVVGDTPLIAYKKPLSLSGSNWKIYDPLKQDGRGDQSVYVELNNELADLAMKAKYAIGKDIIGFDFISTDSGYIIVDENSRPGLYQHCLDSAGVNIGETITQLIKDRVSAIDKIK